MNTQTLTQSPPVSQTTNINLSFTCRVQRKHFFKDVTYHLSVLQDQLIMSQSSNYMNPKYVLLLNLNHVFQWIMANKQIIGFKFPYNGNLKDFFGLPKDMLALKERLGCYVTYERLDIFYKNEGVIQAGNFGKVCKAIDRMSNRVVAVKHIKIDGKQTFQAQIMNEIDVLKRVRHNNIMRLLEVYRDDQGYQLVTEYIEGDTLKQTLEKRQQPFPVDEALQILDQLLSGVKAIHDQQIIHRDLKPSNIIYSNKTIKILDFGLACINGRQMKEFPTCGTAGYAAPEVLNVLKNKTPYDYKADIFSIGCIFYKIITLQGLFQTNNEQQTYINNRDCIFNIKEKGKQFDIARLLVKPNPDERPSAAQLIPMIKTVADFNYFDINVWYTNTFKQQNPELTSRCLTDRHTLRRQNTVQQSAITQRNEKKKLTTLTKQ